MGQDLSREELLRYSRHTILPEVGLAGQQKLKAAKVLLIGAGGLGSPAALYLAASGVGQLGIVDFDAVDLTNLHRQVIHGTEDVGRPKLDSAADTIRGINPNVQVIKHEVLLNRENVLDIMKGYDLVVDGTDNFATRYLVNDACILLGKTNIYGSILAFEGQATVFCAPGGPCYRCLYPEPPPPGVVPSCAENGVLGVLPGIVGLIQATEAVKWILGIGESLTGRLLLYDATGMRFTELAIQRDPDCPVCGDHPTLTELDNYEQLCGLPAKPTTQPAGITPAELQKLMDSRVPFILLDVRDPDEYAEVRIPCSVLIPLGELSGRLAEINRELPLVVHCHSGGRSAQACQFLQDSGFGSPKNLQGGILAWMAQGGEILT